MESSDVGPMLAWPRSPQARPFPRTRERPCQTLASPGDFGLAASWRTGPASVCRQNIPSRDHLDFSCMAHLPCASVFITQLVLPSNLVMGAMVAGPH